MHAYTDSCVHIYISKTKVSYTQLYINLFTLYHKEENATGTSRHFYNLLFLLFIFINLQTILLKGPSEI